MAYIIEWVAKEAMTKKKPLRNIDNLYGIIDLMFILENYKDRSSAKKRWLRLVSEWGQNVTPHTTPNFWVKYEIHHNHMDFCTMTDFLDKILPKLSGPVAETIKKARSTSATLVATGSQMAVDLTMANAASTSSAPASVRQLV